VNEFFKVTFHLLTLAIPACVAIAGCASESSFAGKNTLGRSSTLPFSDSIRLLSPQESAQMEYGGKSGTPVVLTKPIRGANLKQYKSFDANIAILRNIEGREKANQYSQVMRQTSADIMKQRGFKVVDPNDSDAGVASVFAPFQAQSGRTAFELVVIVFDRKKGMDIINESPGKKGLSAIYQSAAWISVARLYPQIDLGPEPNPTEKETLSVLKKLFDAAFNKFMSKTEYPQIHFDNRIWTEGHRANRTGGFIVEFVHQGETVENWTELVTWEFFQTLKTDTLEGTMDRMKLYFSEKHPNITWNVISKSDTDLIYEWKLQNDPTNEDQHEIARMMRGENGIHLIRYTIKTPNIPSQKREEWLNLLREIKFEGS
jgi:hypothetical protein